MIGEEEPQYREGEDPVRGEAGEQQAGVTLPGEDFSREAAEEDTPGFADAGADLPDGNDIEAGGLDQVAAFLRGGEARETAVTADRLEESRSLPGGKLWNCPYIRHPERKYYTYKSFSIFSRIVYILMKLRVMNRSFKKRLSQRGYNHLSIIIC